MTWRGRQTQITAHTKRVQVWDDKGELIYDMDADTDQVANPAVQWEADRD